MSPEAQGFTSELAELMAYTAESIVFGYFGLTAVAYTSDENAVGFEFRLIFYYIAAKLHRDIETSFSDDSGLYRWQLGSPTYLLSGLLPCSGARIVAAPRSEMVPLQGFSLHCKRKVSNISIQQLFIM